MMPLRTAALAVAILVFAAPELSVALRGAPASYLLVTIAFTVVLVAIVSTWRDARVSGSPSAPPSRWSRLTTAISAAGGAAILVIAAYRWTDLVAWRPYNADMLIVIREATRRILAGHDPYATYRSYDTSWEMAMPYGPVLWGPYLVSQITRSDLRIVTVIGELFAPAWCAATAAIEAVRGRTAAAGAWLAVMAALVAAFDVQHFTLIGHTPAYWPWLLLLAIAVTGARWTGAACLLALLVAARTTMVAIVPPFLMAVWWADRRKLRPALIALILAGLAVLGPFLLWNPRALWEQMVLSYPRVIEGAVWPVLAKPGLETIGVTEWLLERRLDVWVVPIQFAAMLAAYAAAWVALARGRPALPWMALALFAFSMTTLYPVHYLYYDVLLLLVCAAVAETLRTADLRRMAVSWLGSIATLAVLTLIAVRTTVPPFPHAAIGDGPSRRMLQDGFSGIEYDGPRGFSWIVGPTARIALPRSSAAAADIVLTGESPFDANQPPQRMTAVLNGSLLGEIVIPAGRQEIRIAAPRSAWWIGFNDLRLSFAATQSPREAGTGPDTRPLAESVGRIDIVPR